MTKCFYCPDNPPNCPFVSHDSGLFHGTLETGSPLESTVPACAAESALVLEQPTWQKLTGSNRRSKRR
jgi:hypothetical protein